jgi:hypothetical protein
VEADGVAELVSLRQRENNAHVTSYLEVGLSKYMVQYSGSSTGEVPMPQSILRQSQL